MDETSRPAGIREVQHRPVERAQVSSSSVTIYSISDARRLFVEEYVGYAQATFPLSANIKLG